MHDANAFCNNILWRRRDLVRSFLPYADLREREDSVRKALAKQENGNDSE